MGGSWARDAGAAGRGRVMPEYVVTTGLPLGLEVTKRDDNIGAARAWARRAFGPGASVRRLYTVRPRCAWCDSRPCECPRVRAREDSTP